MHAHRDDWNYWVPIGRRGIESGARGEWNNLVRRFSASHGDVQESKFVLHRSLKLDGVRGDIGVNLVITEDIKTL